MKTSKQFTMPCFLVMISLIILLSGNIYAQDKGTFADKRDGHEYAWAKMGKQVWMTENLRFKTPAGSWIFNNDSLTDARYGRLYDWITASKACPKGWHLPSDNEWGALITFLGGDYEAGGKLLEMEPKDFNSLLAGVRHNDETFTGIGIWGGFWSATADKSNKDVANNILFARGTKSLGRSSNNQGSGFSVRCVRNK